MAPGADGMDGRRARGRKVQNSESNWRQGLNAPSKEVLAEPSKQCITRGLSP
jgi:hypothetical protein